jgi:hypothetical protein
MDQVVDCLGKPLSKVGIYIHVYSIHLTFKSPHLCGFQSQLWFFVWRCLYVCPFFYLDSFLRIGLSNFSWFLVKEFHGWVVMVINFKPLALDRCSFESRQGIWMLSWKEAIELAYRTSVVLLRCLFVPEIMKGTWGFPPSVKLERCHMTLCCVGAM